MNPAILFCFLTMMVATQLVRADDAEEIREQLTDRWFEVELIVFERLGTFDFNTVEKLTSTEPPRWPTYLVEYDIPKAIAAPQPIIESLPETDDATEPGVIHLPTHPEVVRIEHLFGPDRLCVGYPALPEADKLHPILQTRRFAEDLLNELLTIPMKPPLASNNIQFIFTETGTSDLHNIDNVDTGGRLQSEPPGTIPLEKAATNLDPVPDLKALRSSENIDAPSPDTVTEAKSSVAAMTQSELPREQPPSPVALFQLELKAWEQMLIDHSFTWSPARALGSSVRAINRQPHLRPLFHQRWIQRVPGRSNPLPIRLALPNDLARLQGTIDITVARYLHLNIDLWYEASAMAEVPRLFSHEGSSQPVAPDPSYMYIQASRRMRSKEMHYIDHPIVGIIAYIDPVSVPEDLLHHWQSLVEAEALD